MKRLLLALVLPSSLAASEQQDVRTTAQKVATHATHVAFVGASGYNGANLAIDLFKTLGSGDYLGAGLAVMKAGSQVLTIATTTATTLELIDPKPTESPLEIAAKESAARMRIAEETAATNFMHCLNENSRCTDLNPRGIPKRCISPARRFAMLNEPETARMIARFNQYKN